MLRDHLEYVDQATRELRARHRPDHFPREVQVRIVGKGEGVVRLFNVDTRVFPGNPIAFPAEVNGAKGRVRYEPYHQRKVGDEEVVIYRKIDENRRVMERSGMILPGRG